MFLESAVIFSAVLSLDDITASDDGANNDNDGSDDNDDDDGGSFSCSGNSLTESVLGIMGDGSVGEVRVDDVGVLHVVDRESNVGVVLGHVELCAGSEDGDLDVLGVLVGRGVVDGEVAHAELDVQRLVVREGFVLRVAVVVGGVQLEREDKRG